MSLDRLTPRERQVLTLRCDYYSYGEIATRLGIAPKTVQQHLVHAKNKAGCDSIRDTLREFRSQLVVGGEN